MKKKIMLTVIIILMLTASLTACDIFGGKDNKIENPVKFLEFTLEYDGLPLFFDYNKKIPINKTGEKVTPLDFVFTFENPDKHPIISVKINGEIFYSKDFKLDTPQKIILSYAPQINDELEIRVADIYYKVNNNNYSIKNLDCPILKCVVNPIFNMKIDRSQSDNDVKELNYEIGFLGDFDYFLPPKGNDFSLESENDTFKKYNIFKGYFLDEEGKKIINEGDIYRFNYDITVYALFEDNYSYVSYEDHAEIVGFNKYTLSLTDYAFNIPNTYNGLPITKIADGAFANCTAGFNLKLNENLLEIGSESFKNSKLIINFELANKLEKIGGYAFQNVGAVSIRKFPESLKEIGEGAFIGCSWNSVKPSGTGALGTALVIDNNIKIIGKDAFKNSLFKKVYIMEGNSELELGEGVFEAMPNLEEVNFAAKFSDISTILLPPTLPSVKIIPTRCFYGNVKLSNISLHEGAEEIGENAFARNFALKKFEIPISVQTVNNKAFIACNSLTSFDILTASKLVKIGDEVFSGCTALKSLDIKSTNLAFLGSSVFYNCLQMQSIFFYGRAPFVKSGDYLYIEGNNDFFIYTPKDYLDDYKHNFSAAKDYYKLRITAKEYILVDDKGARDNIACFELLNDGTLKLLRVFDKNIKNLNVALFEGDYKLDASIRSKKITEVGENFVAKSVEEVILPSSIKTIANGAFKNCVNLSKVSSNGDYTLRDLEKLEYIGEQAFESTKINKFYAPKNLKTIGAKAFYDCKNLTEVKIINLENELTIGRDAFYLSPLVTVYLGKNVVSVGNNAFSYSLTSIESPLRELYIFRETSASGALSATDFGGTLYFHSDIKIYLPKKDGVKDLYMRNNNLKALNASGNVYFNEKIENEQLYNQ